MSRVRVYVLNNIASMVLRPRLTEELQIHGEKGFYTYTNLVSLNSRTIKSLSSSSPDMTLSIVLVTSNKALSYPSRISAESLQSNNV